ncbi:MAG: VOC family protein [Planctomycetota bacterium]|nr:VOC family protein [Planctomycetota bacterium]
MLKALAHVCLSSTQLEATERFFCSTLGMKKKFSFIKGGKVFGFYLQVSDENYIEVFAQEEIDTKAKLPIRHFCLEVSSIDEIIGKLKADGFEASEKKRGNDKSWQCWTTDPSGIRIEFQEYTRESSQKTGADCITG